LTAVVLVRHAESLANLAGAIAGWTDVRLTEYGRKQAASLYEGLQPHLPRFKQIYSSDLKRCTETLAYSTVWSWPYKTDERLREMYFGEEEGEHFDSLPDAKKAGYNDMNYVAPGGEGWLMVRRRSQQFFRERLEESGVYLCYTHGGLMCTLTYDLGIKDVLPNCSVVALSMEEGRPTNLLFAWECPEILSQ
jgi:probable phosphoglycerate mutase